VLGEGECGVEFPEDPVGVRGADGGDGGVVRVNGNKVVLYAGREEGEGG
jgi:hypothetical protein